MKLVIDETLAAQNCTAMLRNSIIFYPFLALELITKIQQTLSFPRLLGIPRSQSLELILPCNTNP